MKIDLSEILSASIVLFAVINIIGSIPLIIDIKARAASLHYVKASMVAFFIMVLFLLFGESLIGLFGIDVQSFAVAGAFVLLIIALEMILGIPIFKVDANSIKAASIMPIAFPIIAGPGSMTSIVSLRAEYETINIFFAICLNMVLVFVVLKLTNRIGHLLGAVGIAIMQKMFGIILLAISVKLFSANALLLFSK